MAKPRVDIALNVEKEFISPLTNLNDNKQWKWYKTWNDEILIVGNVYKVKNEFCVYAGSFENKEQVPKVNCCYSIGDILRVRHLEIDRQNELPIHERKRHYDDERPIDTTIKDSNNTLMILIKTALQYKNINRGDFKQFYPNISDMNNILRCIEKGDNLSWGRFSDLVEKLGITYNLSIYNNNEKIVDIK